MMDSRTFAGLRSSQNSIRMKYTLLPLVAILIWALPAPGQDNGQSNEQAKPTPSLTTRIRIVSQATQAALPHAEVLWMGEYTHAKNLRSRTADWPYGKQRILQTAGHAVTTDEKGEVILEAPLGGIFFMASAAEPQTGKHWGMGAIPSGVESFTLELPIDVEFQVRVEVELGEPVRQGRLTLQGFPGGRVTSRSPFRRLQSATTDELGIARFPHAQHTLFPGQAIDQQSFDALHLRIQLDLIGNATQSHAISFEQWSSREFVWVVPPMGYVELPPSRSGPDGSNLGERHLVWTSEQYSKGRVRSISSESSAAGLPAGARIRSLAPLDQEFVLFTFGDPLLGCIETHFEGPTEPEQTVFVPSMNAADRVWVEFSTDLKPPVTNRSTSYLRLQIQEVSPTSSYCRAIIPLRDLRQDGSFSLWVARQYVDQGPVPLGIRLIEGSEMVANLSKEVVLSSAEPVPLALQLHLGPTTDSLPTLLAGVVLDATGRPVPGAVVQIREDLPTAPTVHWAKPKDLSRGHVLADEQGRFHARSRSDALRLQVAAYAPGLGMLEALETTPHAKGLTLILEPLTKEARIVLPNFTHGFTSTVSGPTPNRLRLLHTEGSPIVRQSFISTWRSSVLDFRHQPKSTGFPNRHEPSTDALGRMSIPSPDPDIPSPYLEVFTKSPTPPYLYARVNLERIDDEVQDLPMQELSPSLAGVLLDQDGKPIAGAPLKLILAPTPPAPYRRNSLRQVHPIRGPVLRTETGPDGGFEFYSFPDGRNLSVELTTRDQLELVQPYGFMPGSKGVYLTALRLGSVRFEAFLPTNVRLPMELVSATQSEVVWPQMIDGIATITRLPPGQHRIKITLPKRSLGPQGGLSDAQRLVHEGEPFVVTPTSEGEATPLPTIDLRNKVRELRLKLSQGGEPFTTDHLSLAIRSSDGAPLPFASQPSRNGSGEWWVLLPQVESIEIAARAFKPWQEGLPELSSRALQSDWQAVPNDSGDLQLPLRAMPSLHFQFDPQTIAAMAPYSPVAILAADPAKPTPGWIVPEDRYDLSPIRFFPIGPDGSVHVHGWPDWNTGHAPGSLYLALGHNAANPKGRLSHDFDDAFRSGEERKAVSIAYHLTQADFEKWSWVAFLPAKGSPANSTPHFWSRERWGKKRNPQELHERRWSFPWTSSNTGSLDVSIPPESVQRAKVYMEANWTKNPWLRDPLSPTPDKD